MGVTIKIPTALRQFTQDAQQISVTATTVREALEELTDKYPDVKKNLLKDDGTLRSFINIYVNEDNIRQKNGLDTEVSENDIILLIPSIAGGSPDDTGLSKDEVLRYSRHLLLPEVGVEGQKKLKKSRVLMIGTGGLGAPAALYLAAAGIGTLGIVDFDFVEASNLQRQIIHGTRDIGRPKTASAKDRIKSINPKVEVVDYNVRLSSENALQIIKDYDVVVDGTDNFQTRYLVNDACVFLKKPNVYGSVFRFEGQSSVFFAEEGPCYRCLYPEPPPPGLVPSCAEGGILGVVPGIIGCIQANETIKLLIGGAETLIGRLLLFDAWRMKFQELKLAKDPECPVCGKNPTVTQLIDYEQFCGLKKAKEEAAEEITARELKKRLDANEGLQIIDVRQPHELNIGKIPGAVAIPYGQVVRRMAELDPSKDVVIVCKVGVVSSSAARMLKEAGYTGRLYNLKEGINAWARDVDTSIPQY